MNSREEIRPCCAALAFKYCSMFGTAAASIYGAEQCALRSVLSVVFSVYNISFNEAEADRYRPLGTNSCMMSPRHDDFGVWDDVVS